MLIYTFSYNCQFNFRNNKHINIRQYKGGFFMSNRNNRRFILAMLLLALFLTGAYALFAANLDIRGTATGTADFRIEFSNHEVSNNDKATVTLNDTNTVMNITADLLYPGDNVTIDFTIRNMGTLSALVNNLVINENTTEDITININGLNNIIDTVLDVGETTTGSIVITWNTSSTNQNPDQVNFDVTIDYLQAT